jgi:hypothetical protein
MRKYPRIEIDQKAFDGLQIEAVLKRQTVREIATNAILGYISKEAIMVLDHKTYSTAEVAEPKPSIPAKSPPKTTGAHKQLVKDEAKVAQIKHLWSSTDLPVAEIARQVGGKRQTVSSIIERLIAKGELQERPKTAA